MLPWGHLAVGYLVYTAGTHLRARARPEEGPTLALAVGTQFPDLVDKPLNWWFDVYDGRAIAHSLVTMLPLCALVVWVARRYGRGKSAGAFAVGALTHLLGDAWQPLLAGRFTPVSFLLWPFYEPPTYVRDSLAAHLRVWLLHLRSLSDLSLREAPSGGFAFQLLLALLVVGVWAFDGFPGVGPFRRALDRATGDR